MADQKINELPTKTAPSTGDKMLMIGTAEEYQIDYDQLATAILNKLSTQSFSSLDTTSKTVLGAIDELNSKSFFATYEANSAGWKRVAKYGGTTSSVANGSHGNTALIFLRTTFNSTTNMTALIIFESAYAESSFKILSRKGSTVISKIRYVIDTNENMGYIEVYYNSNQANRFTVSMPCNIDGGGSYHWLPTDGESTDETVEGVKVVSSLDLA